MGWLCEKGVGYTYNRLEERHLAVLGYVFSDISAI